jgi:DNA-binding beta-propeller fold protein YncE
MKATFYSKSKQTLALLLLCFGIVTLLPAQTTVTQAWAAPGISPYAIAVDASGNVYAPSFTNNTVSKITPAGVATQTWAALSSGAKPYAIALDASGNVYTANQNNNTVSKITSAGVVTQTWAALASGATPNGIAIDASGNRLVVS